MRLLNSLRSVARKPVIPVTASAGRRGWRAFRRLGLVVLVIVAAVCGVLVWADWWVVSQTTAYIYKDDAALPSRPAGVVFGARVHPGGILSDVLRARVDAGVQLYKAGKVKKLLMTGDNGRRDYDEVSAMKNYAVSHGVPAADVVRDFAGFRTFDSCYRLRHVFQVDQAILITQAYHLPRAVFTARRLGIDAVGFAAEPGVDEETLQSFETREYLAVANAVIESYLFPARPKFAGPVEPLFGDNRVNR